LFREKKGREEKGMLSLRRTTKEEIHPLYRCREKKKKRGRGGGGGGFVYRIVKEKKKKKGIDRDVRKEEREKGSRPLQSINTRRKRGQRGAFFFQVKRREECRCESRK